MAESLTIPKNNASFPDYLDFDRLRSEGIRHIQELAGKVWTDYNLHDPGITILEVLCYALTDLGYRTNFDIKDLLARKPEDNNTKDNNFFTAAEILTCNPTTIHDYRKLLIDIPGVRNAWLEKAKQAEYPLYINCRDSKLQFNVPENTSAENAGKLNIGGLYNVYLDLEPERMTNACGEQYTSHAGIVNKVKQKLHQHRNLTEDFLNIRVLGEEAIAICADIELENAADPQDVMVELYDRIHRFLSPSLNFYSLQEMLDMGQPTEKIFEGRPLTYDSHGFINTDELDKLERKTVLYSSDIYQLLMGIEGVLAVKKLEMINYIDGVPQSHGDKWCLPLTNLYKPVFSPGYSQINFYKGALPFNLSPEDQEEVSERFQERLTALNKAKLEPWQLDLPIPEGTYYNLQDYTSIQREFPLTYRIGQDELGPGASAERKAQARQLKGYLMFFDQLLANYLAQLAHIRDLFAMNSNPGPSEELRTYYTQFLSNVPHKEDMIINYQDCNNSQDEDFYKNDPLDYPDYLNFIAEDENTFNDRRNRFLNHLLARFSEQFTDYVLLMYKMNGKKQEEARVIKDKEQFLSDYPKISRNRGKAFDYTNQDELWNTEENVSGLQKRVARLVGIEDYSRRSLSNCEIIHVDEQNHFEIRNNDGAILLKSHKPYEDRQHAEKDAQLTIKNAAVEENYRSLAYDNFFHYGIDLIDSEGAIIATHQQLYTDEQKRNARIDNIVEYYSNNPGDKPSAEIIERNDRFYFQFQLKPDNLLFESYESFEDTADAENRFNQFAASTPLPWQETRFFSRTTKGGFTHYGFGVADQDDALLASAPTLYSTKELRDTARFKTLRFFAYPRLSCHVQQAGNCFYFEVYDHNADKLLFKSNQGYDTNQEAHNALNDFLESGKDKNNYQLTSDNGQFSFNLLKNGNVLALHPHHYNTEAESEEQVQAIIHYLSETNIPEGVHENHGFFYQLIKPENYLVSDAKYNNTEDANNAYDQIKELAKDKSRYVLQNDMKGACKYSFYLTGENGMSIANHPGVYKSAKERDIRIEQIISETQEDKVFSHQRTDGSQYIVYLLPEYGKVAFENKQPYENQQQANKALQDVKKWAAQKNRYKKLDNPEAPDQYGFALTNLQNNEVALHPETYDTEKERDEAINELTAYAGGEGHVTNVEKRMLKYKFQLKEPNGKILAQSTASWSSLQIAKENYEQFLQDARNPEHYQNTRNSENTKPFSFAITDSEGHVTALSTERFAGEPERNARIQRLLNYVNDYEIKHSIITTEGAYYYVLFDKHEREKLFESTGIYKTKEQADNAFQEFLTHAQHYNRYTYTQSNRGNCTLSFSLKNEQGAIIATHPHNYGNDKNRKQAVNNIINYVSANGPFHKITAQSDSYIYELQDSKGNTLFISKNSFPDQTKAETAYDEFKTLAQQEEMYQRWYDNHNCQYGFDLINLQQEFVARHPVHYTSRKERDDKIEAIIDYMQPYTINYELPGTACGYYIHINSQAPENDPLLKSTFGYPSEPLAWKACQRILHAAENKAHYQNTDDTSNDSYSFYLNNEHGEQIAIHPENYTSNQHRNLNIAITHNAITRQDAVSEITTQNNGFTFLLKDGAGNTLLSGEKVYDSRSKAKAGFQEALNRARNAVNYKDVKNDQDKFGFKLVKGSETLATHPDFYDDKALRDLARKAVQTFLTQSGTDYHLLQTGPLFTHRLIKDDETILRSIHGIEYKKAAHPDRYTTKEARDQKINDTVKYFTNHNLNTPIEEQNGQFYIILKDNGGNILLKSEKTFNTKEAAREELQAIETLLPFPEYYIPIQSTQDNQVRYSFILGNKEAARQEACHTCNTFMELAQDEASFRLVNEEDTCQYSFELINKAKQALAESPGFFAGKQARQKGIQQVMDQVNKEGFHLIEHLLLRPQEKGEAPLWYPVLRDEFGAELLIAEQNFAQQDKARNTYQSILDAGAVKNNYEITESANTACPYQVSLYNNNNTKVASHPLSYSLKKEAKEAIDKIVKQVKATEPGKFYYFKLVHTTLEVLFVSAGNYETPEKAQEAFNQLLKLAKDNNNYQKLNNTEATLPYGINLKDEDGNIIAYHPRFYKKEEDRDKEITNIQRFINHSKTEKHASIESVIKNQRSESHPGKEDPRLFPIHVDPEDCTLPEEEACLTNADPYSYWCTIVLPYWPQRFQDMNFRSFFEQTIRKEAPAHVALKICWVDVCQMEAFEAKYKTWLKEKAAYYHNEASCNFTQALNGLIEILTQLNNVYPEATLHDCQEGSSEDNPLILNQTILGTTNTNENGNT